MKEVHDGSKRHIKINTGGRKRQLTWNLEGVNLEHYAEYLTEAGELDTGSIDRTDREVLKKAFWDFTKEKIDGIIKEFTQSVVL